MTDSRRRPWVVGGFLVLGTLLLGVSFRIEPGSPWFYPAAAALAAAWAVGGLLGGPPALGDRRPLAPIGVGLGLAGLFVLGGLVLRELPFLADRVVDVTAYLDRGEGPLVVVVALVTGVAEELFFRGALYDAVPRPVLVTTVLYGAATVATGNAVLVLAAVVLGATAALVRRETGGVLAPALVHATWSVAMLLALPAIF